MPNVLKGDLDGSGLRVGIAVSRFSKIKKNGKPIGEVLLEGCVERLRDAGVADEDITVAFVPGAMELPLAAKALAGIPDHATDEPEDAEDSKGAHATVRNGNGHKHSEKVHHGGSETEITIENEVVEDS